MIRRLLMFNSSENCLNRRLFRLCLGGFVAVIALIAVLWAPFSESAEAQNPTKWSLEVPTPQAGVFAPGAKADAKVSVAIEPGWHLYALDQPQGGPIPTTIDLVENSKFKTAGDVVSPKPIQEFDPNFKIDTKFFKDKAEFGVPLEALESAAVSDVALKIRFQLCNDTLCLPPKTIRLTVAGEELYRKPGAGGAASAPVQNPAAAPAPAENDISGFVWLAITLGALSLLTPCVFPMIPITVSYFTKNSGRGRGKSIKLAGVYSFGIIATFTLLGMLLAIFVGAAGINLFAANPWVNILIAGMFLFFAFNLFGAYEIQVPSGLLNRLDSLTRSKEGEGGGIIGAALMGLTFTLTSFTCTSPFVGTILVSASQGDWQMPLVGMLAFSTVFALPFFVLALVPQLLTQLPRSGGWMNAVKVSMGFLEVAAAMKFISNVDLVWGWGIFTRDVVLAIWIAIGVVLSLYLLGKFQLHHDSPPERIGAGRLVSAIVSLSVSFYLLTGLFGAKLGELESFLPPDLSGTRAAAAASTDQLTWMKDDLDGALAKAKAENKRVFIDFTGYTCTNCRWMEANVFIKPEVEAELRNFVTVKLFTDGQGEVYERQQAYQEATFRTVALPFYAVLESDGTVVSTFPGLTRNVPEFVGFLRSAQGS